MISVIVFPLLAFSQSLNYCDQPYPKLNVGDYSETRQILKITEELKSLIVEWHNNCRISATNITLGELVRI